MSNENAKEKIRKLLNLANDAGAFDGEIDNALRFARRLMLQHNITEAELKPSQDAHEMAADADYSQADTVTHGANLSTWESTLMHAIVTLIGTIGHYRTHQVMEKKSAAGTLIFDLNGKPETGIKVVFYGPEEDAKDAAMMFDEWKHVVAAMARMKFGGCFRGDGRSYAEGFTASLLEKVRSIHREEVKEIENMSTSGALVVRHGLELMKAKQDAAKAWLAKDQGIKLHTSIRTTARNNANAYGAGRADGKQANFSRSRALRIG